MLQSHQDVPVINSNELAVPNTVTARLLQHSVFAKDSMLQSLTGLLFCKQLQSETAASI